MHGREKKEQEERREERKGRAGRGGKGKGRKTAGPWLGMEKYPFSLLLMAVTHKMIIDAKEIKDSQGGIDTAI